MPVPKVIHFIWAGGTRLLPKNNAKRLKEWANKNPGFEVVLWIDKKTTPAEVLDQYNNEMYAFNQDPKITLKDITEAGVADEYSRFHIDKKIPNYGASSDILRYAILTKFGGAYFDSDITVTDKTQPLNYNGLFDSDEASVLKISQYTQNHKTIGNDAFIFTPEHPFVKELYEQSKANHRTASESCYGSNIYLYETEAKDSTLKRASWTIECTGPGAVVALGRSMQLISGDSQTLLNSNHALDTQCYQALNQNEHNWLMFKYQKYETLDQAINATLKEIQFEAKNMGFLAIDHHILTIKMTLSDHTIDENHIAERLIDALKANPPTLTHVSQIQLLSKFDVVRRYYSEVAPGLEDNFMIKNNDKRLANTFQQLKSLLNSDSTFELRDSYKYYIFHVQNIISNKKDADITLNDVDKLLFCKAMRKNAYPEIPESQADTQLFKDTLIEFLNNHHCNKGISDPTMKVLKKIIKLYIGNRYDNWEEMSKLFSDIKSSITSKDNQVVAEKIMESLEDLGAENKEKLYPLKIRAFVNRFDSELKKDENYRDLKLLDKIDFDQAPDNILNQLKELVSKYKKGNDQTFFNHKDTDVNPSIAKQLMSIIQKQTSLDKVIDKAEQLYIKKLSEYESKKSTPQLTYS